MTSSPRDGQPQIRDDVRRRAILKGEVFAIFATAPAVDADELRGDLDEDVSQDVGDPYEGTGL